MSNLQSIVSSSSFDIAKITVFFFYGFTQTPNSDQVVEVKDAYVANGGYNFILIALNPVEYNVLVSFPAKF